MPISIATVYIKIKVFVLLPKNCDHFKLGTYLAKHLISEGREITILIQVLSGTE